MSITLYSITDELAVITDELISMRGELTPEMEKRLDENGQSLAVKAESVWMVLKNMEANNNAIDAEIKRLKALKIVRGNAMERFKDYIKRCMDDAGLKKLDSPLGGFTIRKSPASVEIVDESKIPFDLMTIVPETQRPDKKAIGDLLKKNEAVAGAILITDKTTLKVR